MPMTDHRRQDENLARAAAEADQTCVWTLTLDGEVEHLSGHSQSWGDQDLMGRKPWRECWPEENRTAVDRAVERAALGKVSRFRHLGAADRLSRTYWATVISPVRAANGVVVSLVATSSDVTAEVEREALLDTVVQMLPSPLAVKDVDAGRYILWNRAAEQAFGLESERVVGTSRLDAAGAELADALVDAEVAAVRTGETQYRSVAMDMGARRRAFDLKTVATYDDFGARHLISLCNDVSERDAAASALQSAVAAAEQASEAKSQFLANMSHELRTPMNGIVASADMLAKEDLSARSRELTSLIQGSATGLERLLSSLLDLASIEAGGMTIEPTPFQFGDLTREVASLADLSAAEKGVGLQVMVAPEADGMVLGDPVRVRQVFANLLSNAVKFTEHGCIRLEVARVDEAVVAVSVTDTGIGFDDVAKARIFERFHQADPTTTRRFGGSGLGLAITKELVVLMGGALHCESKPGCGARFWFELPLPRHADVEPTTCGADEGDAPAGLKVLVADDHPTNRRVIEIMLSNMAELVGVTNGREAVDAYCADEFDVVLMDMQMPVMDGLSAVREIRRIERERGRAPLPIIMLTANVGSDHCAASHAAGADLHLGKPITTVKLFKALREVLV